MIGLDTSHAPAFAELLNGPEPAGELAGVKVVAAFPGGSPDLPASADRVEGLHQETGRDGGRDRRFDRGPAAEGRRGAAGERRRPAAPGAGHCRCSRPGSRCSSTSRWPARWPTRWRSFELAKQLDVPCFSSSSLRFSPGILGMRDDPRVGEVLGCEARGPCTLEPHHPDLFWYGIHGVETLFTIMGTGCEAVSRVQTDGTEFVVGRWNDGRVGTFRGLRDGAHGYGATVFGSQGDRPQRRLRRLPAAGGRDRQVLQDRQAAGQRRGDARNLRLHGSRRREQAARRRAGDDRKRAGQGAASRRRDNLHGTCGSRSRLQPPNVAPRPANATALPPVDPAADLR